MLPHTSLGISFQIHQKEMEFQLHGIPKMQNCGAVKRSVFAPGLWEGGMNRWRTGYLHGSETALSDTTTLIWWIHVTGHLSKCLNRMSNIKSEPQGK